MGERQGPRRDSLEDRRRGGRTQPVVGGVGLRGGDDGVIHRGQFRARPGQQGGRPLRQGAMHATAVMIKPVLDPAVGATGQWRHPGAVGAEAGGDTGRRDEAAILLACLAGPPTG
jgi:hypothetical protein